MSFSLHAEGLLADVVEQVTAAEGDEQFQAVRAFVLSELEAWPTEPPARNGVLLEIAGHAEAISRNVTVVMRPIHVGPPED
ncbi:hypothetical protein ACJWDR_37470 [Streptomyces tauricus]|uniref:hypothetical protein n=1 Tax=Streptomyces tauricus TaxID=68274 RepID=UPI00387F223E